MQATLFDVAQDEPTAPYAPHSETSRAAAEEILPSLNRLQARVLSLFACMGAIGLTDWEIEQDTGMNPSTIRPRRVELADSGSIEQVPGVKRPTGSGRAAQVWRITEAGRRRLEEDSDGE